MPDYIFSSMKSASPSTCSCFFALAEINSLSNSGFLRTLQTREEMAAWE